MCQQGPTEDQDNDSFEIEYLDDDDDNDDLENDEQLHCFYDELLDISIDMLVNKLLALHPLLSACMHNTPSLISFALNNENERRKLQKFTADLKSLLSPLGSSSVDAELFLKFSLAFSHMQKSRGYSMSKYLHKHLLIFEFLKENTEPLFSTQQAFLNFSKSGRAKRKLNTLKMSMGPNENVTKKTKRVTNLRATQ
ncbi:MAG: hypothetical protein JSR17_04730 [Proteobacteria bacterium]|nr:hypothetical protein [Pseudomonadota bacterium]